MDEKVFKIFINRDDCYSFMGSKGYFTVKKPLTNDLLKKHLEGKITIGVFQLSKDNKVKWICWDYDKNENQTLKDVFEETKKLYKFLKRKGFHPLLEFSGSRGYHVWLFFDEIDALIAKRFAEEMAEKSGSHPHEIFPKQTRLRPKGFGNLVKLPLGIHKVSNKVSFLFDYNFKKLNIRESLNLLKNQKIDRIRVESLSKFGTCCYYKGDLKFHDLI